MTGFVYRYWDQPELNRQMSARGTVPDFMPIMDVYAGRAEADASDIRRALDLYRRRSP